MHEQSYLICDGETERPAMTALTKSSSAWKDAELMLCEASM